MNNEKYDFKDNEPQFSLDKNPFLWKENLKTEIEIYTWVFTAIFLFLFIMIGMVTG